MSLDDEIGVFIVGVGDRAREGALDCIRSLRFWHDWPVRLIGDQNADIPGVSWYPPMGIDRGYRRDKLRLWEVSDPAWNIVIYLDADTRVKAPLDDLVYGFFEGGYELAIAPSKNQGEYCFAHIPYEERNVTVNEVGYTPVQWQAGVMFWRRTDNAMAFFEAWLHEWSRWRDMDQAAFVRALENNPLSIMALSHVFNGGVAIEHRFGAFRSK